MNTNTCNHNWQYVDALGYWEDDYYIYVEDIYFCPLCKTFLHAPAGTAEEHIKYFEEVEKNEIHN